MLFWILRFLVTFLLMEFAAWFLHKYVMHGFLWNLHYDHHNLPKDRKWQYNDLFAVFFAVPSFLLILFGKLQANEVFSSIGYGIMFYGAVYFTVHEVIIHRRFKLFNLNTPYFQSLKIAHKIHHHVKGKEGAKEFAMLIPNFKEWKRLSHLKKKR